ncbi:serine/threonine-protein kinase Sgk2-like isoform X2 [Babylonia areolata]|uniref:serine/threonine-protein kinase Sgk2-like isoform X2 n=1 Tax=Babylonia areolata TaxID=304850 RepID=UPI003FD2B99C
MVGLISRIIHKLFPDLQHKVSEGKAVLGQFDPRSVQHTADPDLDHLVHCLAGHPQLTQSPEVRQFLGLDNQRHGQQHQQQKQQQQLQQQQQQFQPSPQQSLDHLKEKMNGENDAQSINLGPTEKPSVRPSDFEFLKVIGKGSFGKVLMARHKAEKGVFAVKVLQKAAIMKRNEAQHIMSERNVLLKNVKHPFLVGLHYSFQTADKLYFVLDYVNGGELFFHLQRERFFPEYRAKFYAAEIASALGYLHSEDIIYRDLKPENILLDSKGHIVLTDFGLCKEGITDEKTTCTFCGTPEYLAPEVLRKQPYDKTVDWWCLGAVLYEMVNGLPPFYSRDTNEMYENILYKPLVHRANISMAGRSILEHLLHKDKSKRLGAVGDLEEVQQTTFFADVNWQDLYDRKVAPPYNPNVSGQLDLRHFDQEFVREPVPNSVGRSGGSSGGRLVSSSVMEANAAFDGFSYVPPHDEAFGL